MTDVLTAIFDGHLQTFGATGRRYSRPSFGSPTSPIASRTSSRGDVVSPTGSRSAAAAMAAMAAPLELRMPPAAAAPWRWRGRHERRSVLPKPFVTFARMVNPF